ncbi:MAG TPA: FtsH protease activity modulator HflK [Burkholderiales bacterium]|nr:FtsH protease activity modulator HflK [Burkholderiales bacterium]
MALNDPNWGKRGNDGPPDLDELWRRFNQRLSAMFGGKGGGSPPPVGVRQLGGIGWLVGLMLLVWLASGFYIVDAPQRGVVLRFGKYVETTEPGPRWHWPWPVESAEVVNVSGNRSVEIGYRNNVKSKVLKESLMITDDENIIDIQFAVQYVLKDPEDYLFNNRDSDATVMQAAESAIREVVGKSKMDFLLYEGKAQVTENVRKLMQDILDRYKTGITISRVTMQDSQAPEQVQAAFDDAVKAGQDRERQKNEAQAYANDVVPKARGTAARLLQEAEGYRQSVIANAEGEASRFRQIVAEYSKAPGVTRDRLYLDAIQQILNNSSKIVVDQKAGGNLLYLPLDKLLQSAGGDAVMKPAQEAVAPVPAPSEAAPRSRDLFRSRDREAR